MISIETGTSISGGRAGSVQIAVGNSFRDAGGDVTIRLLIFQFKSFYVY